MNQTPKFMFGFQPFDKVRYKNQTGFAFGRRTSVYFDIRNLLGEKLSAGVSYKKLHCVEARKSLLVEEIYFLVGIPPRP